MVNTFAGNSMASDKIGLAPRFCVEANQELLATFSECSGLSATVRSDKWEEGGANYTTLKFPGRTDFGNLTLKHGVSFSTELLDWFKDVLRGTKDKTRRDIAILLYTPDLKPLQSWHFSRAFPVKWTGPTLQSTGNAVAIEAIEFAHDGFVEV
jgi:phage tail-like protein